MNTPQAMKTPLDCQDMADIRAEIDRLDAGLMQLLAQRAAYIDRAAHIKVRDGLPARIKGRVDEVLENVARHASGAGLEPDPYVEMWRVLIEWSIAREELVLGKGPSE
jgi:isochorismate pyruvate lyase